MSIRQGIWKHFKGGKYLVLGIASHSETSEEFVVYKALDGEHNGKIFARPIAMFEERVERDGYSGPRFVPVQLVT